MPKTGIVDVGGGYRGIFAAGALDYCIKRGVRFDLGIGVSAGSANLASYAAGQEKRNRRFYTRYGRRKEYASIRNYLKTRSFIDLEYVYGTLSNSDGEDPLDYWTLAGNPMEFFVVACDARTGEAKYFTKEDIGPDQYDVFKASSAIPGVCRPWLIGEDLYFDGALADPVPVEKAFELGCDRVVLLLSRPEDQPRDSKKDKRLASMIRSQYPKAAERLRQRAGIYNASVEKARQYAREGKLLIVAPDDIRGVGTLSRNAGRLRALYDKGRHMGPAIEEFLEQK